MTRIADLPTFDMAEQLRDAEDIAAYLQLALGIIARARHDGNRAKKRHEPRSTLQGIAPGQRPALCHHQ